VAVDTAGNTLASATVTARVVDNNGPVVSVTGPAQVRGTANTVTTTVSDASAIGSVVIRRRAAGSTGAYTTICTDNTGPAYTCTWDVSALADGSSWELIAVATDALGRSTTSAAYTSVVNSTGPTGTDVQSANGGTNGRLDSGDRVIFTFSAQIAPASILAGWSGSSTAIRVRVNNNGTSDSMEFYDSSNTTPLNLLASGTALMINGDHVSAASVFNATIARSGTTVTVTIGSLISGGVRSWVTGSNPMVWQTNPAMTNTTGKGLFPTTVTETGLPDVDF
jgi:chitinase